MLATRWYDQFNSIQFPSLGRRSLDKVLPSVVTRSSLPDCKPPMPAHRLDSRVCGVVLCAKTHTAGMLLGRQFERAQVQKRYRVFLTWGLMLTVLLSGPYLG